MSAALTTGLLLGALALAGDAADTVTLKSGATLHGRVVFEDERRLVLRQGTRESEIEQSTVAHVESLVRNLATLLDNAERTKPGDLGANELLAAQAQESGLDGEAQAFWWRMLLIDKDHEGAHRALGHRHRESGFAIPVGGRAVDWEKRLQLAKDWGSAWEFSSLHYKLRSNLALAVNLDVLLDLERMYRAFYQLFGAELGLYELCRPMNVSLHADAASYPETATEFGYYDPLGDTVQVDASHELITETLVHELTHQLLQNTAFRQRDATGEIPPWLNEGLAEYVAGSLQGASGHLKLEVGHLQARHFRAHARAKSALDLAQVLALSSSDFQVPSDRDLKYAQAYTLVHFLLHGGEGKYRPGFLEFLRAVYRGQGSAKELVDCLHVERRTLEKAWHSYARNQAL